MKPNDIASKFFEKSLAFLEGAIATSKANDSSLFNTAEYMGVTAHLLHHSIELFLKFAIVVATQTLTKNEHSIIKLHGEYKKHYCDSKFDLAIPFVQEPKFLGFNEVQIAAYKSSFSMPTELQLRYPVGHRGEPYSPIMKFNTDYLESCKEQFLRLRCEILPFDQQVVSN